MAGPASVKDEGEAIKDSIFEMKNLAAQLQFGNLFSLPPSLAKPAQNFSDSNPKAPSNEKEEAELAAGALSSDDSTFPSDSAKSDNEVSGVAQGDPSSFFNSPTLQSKGKATQSLLSHNQEQFFDKKKNGSE